MKRYQLYAFMVAGAFSGLAGALIMVNERSVYPDLAHWTQSTQVLLMSLLGGVYTFFGPIIGAALLLTMDADITQDYPEIWQLFLGAVLILILYGLPGGIMGFIQERDIASTDDYVTRMQKTMTQFSRKFWFFFAGTLFFTAFFSLLLAPASWWISEEWEFALLDLRTWGIVPRTIVQAVIGYLLFLPLLRGIRAYSQICRVLVLLLALAPLALHIYFGHTIVGYFDCGLVGTLYVLQLTTN